MQCPLFPRLCCKSPKMLCDQFPANRPNEPQSPIGVAVRPLPRSPVSSSLDNVVPQSIVRSPRLRPRKFVFSHAKRLLQQNPPENRPERNAHGWRIWINSYRFCLGGLFGLNSKILRTNQTHRSAAIVPQRFDHPHHGLERTHSLMVIGASGQNQISIWQRNVCFNPGGEAQSTIDRGSVTS